MHMAKIRKMSGINVIILCIMVITNCGIKCIRVIETCKIIILFSVRVDQSPVFPGIFVDKISQFLYSVIFKSIIMKRQCIFILFAYNSKQMFIKFVFIFIICSSCFMV